MTLGLHCKRVERSAAKSATSAYSPPPSCAKRVFVWVHVIEQRVTFHALHASSSQAASVPLWAPTYFTVIIGSI
jgi:hypothetical protein